MIAPIEQLLSTLHSLGFPCEAGEVQEGPTVTLYEVRPKAGVRVEALARVGKSLAVALCAHSVRIIAPMTGRGTVGIEVASNARKSVSLASVMGAGGWDAMALPLALGQSVSGGGVVCDLAEMPHLLVAGSTGSGKSVCLNSLILSLVSKHDAKGLRLLLIDPKQVELCAFAALPHLLCPIVTKADKAVAALGWVTKEMQRRYSLFASLGVRSLAAHNKQSRAEDKLPRIVVVIDELADLMTAQKGEVEELIARLSALARAAGIHLIICTQRPSVGVVTGVIKANLPSRLAFRVASAVDSRVILDCKGAEALVGKGDALLVMPGEMQPIRVQGCFVSDEEVASLLETIVEGGAQSFVAGWEAAIAGDSSPNEAEGGSEPVLFSIDQACEVLRKDGYAQTAQLQKALRWPKDVAQGCIDEMERRGIVGKGSPEAPRELLVSMSY